MTRSGSLDPLDAGFGPGAIGRFTTRLGGVSRSPWDELNLAMHVGDLPSAVEANRSRLAEQLGGAALAFASQVHGRDVAVIDGSGGPPGPRADGLVTRNAGVALVVQVADCLPVLLADPVHRVVGAAHAGRRGLAGGVLQATVEAMLSGGAQVDDTTAVIGPAICGRCYEVPADMRADVDRLVPGSGSVSRTGTPSLDLAAGAASMLSALGIASVRRTDLCTMEDPRFYSYRRDGVTGRFAGVVMLADRE